MTTIEQALKVAEDAARDMKADRARKRDTDLPFALAAYRGDLLAALVFAYPAGRNDLLTVARIVARGFAPDVLSVAMETFGSEHQTSPVTGRPWANGEMAQVAEHHDGRAKGWVSDALLVMVYNRAGDSAATTLRYRIAGRRVIWADPNPDAGEPMFSGPIHDGLLEAMAMPVLDQLMHGLGVGFADFGLNTGEQAQAHADCAMAKLLLGASFPGIITVPECVVALAAERGTERARIIRRSLPNGKLIRP